MVIANKPSMYDRIATGGALMLFDKETTAKNQKNRSKCQSIEFGLVAHLKEIPLAQSLIAVEWKQ